MKEALISQGIKAFVNHKFKEYGQMTSLQIDTEKKLLSVSAKLAGESETIQGSCHYSIEQQDGRVFFIPKDVQCSREWIRLLAGQILKDREVKIEIPAGLGSTVVKILGI